MVRSSTWTKTDRPLVIRRAASDQRHPTLELSRLLFADDGFAAPATREWCSARQRRAPAKELQVVPRRRLPFRRIRREDASRKKGEEVKRGDTHLDARVVEGWRRIAARHFTNLPPGG